MYVSEIDNGVYLCYTFSVGDIKLTRILQRKNKKNYTNDRNIPAICKNEKREHYYGVVFVVCVNLKKKTSYPCGITSMYRNYAWYPTKIVSNSTKRRVYFFPLLRISKSWYFGVLRTRLVYAIVALKCAKFSQEMLFALPTHELTLRNKCDYTGCTARSHYYMFTIGNIVSIYFELDDGNCSICHWKFMYSSTMNYFPTISAQEY